MVGVNDLVRVPVGVLKGVPVLVEVGVASFVAVLVAVKVDVGV